MSRRTYALARNQPVFRFRYRSDHSHPVRKTLVAVKGGIKPNTVTGYVLRDGNTVYPSADDAPIKTFRRDRIATIRQLDARRPPRKNTPKSRQNQTTLTRAGLESLVIDGV